MCHENNNYHQLEELKLCRKLKLNLKILINIIENLEDLGYSEDKQQRDNRRLSQADDCQDIYPEFQSKISLDNEFSIIYSSSLGEVRCVCRYEDFKKKNIWDGRKK